MSSLVFLAYRRVVMGLSGLLTRAMPSNLFQVGRLQTSGCDGIRTSDEGVSCKPGRRFRPQRPERVIWVGLGMDARADEGTWRPDALDVWHSHTLNPDACHI